MVLEHVEHGDRGHRTEREPRERPALLVALFLTAGTIATAIVGVGAPPAWRESLDSGRWIGFLAGLGLAGAWLRTAPD